MELNLDEAKPGSQQANQQRDIIGRLDTGISKDDLYLAKLGYRSELYRGFSAFMSFAFCFTSVGVICSNALIFPYGINTGGPIMLTFGWIVGSVFTMFIALNLAEICSTYPVSGSVYHWAGILAEKKYAGMSAFICGWFSFIGNTACDASYAYGFSQIIAATVQLTSNGETQLTNAQMSGIAIATLFSFAIKNLLKVDAQGWFNNASAIYQFGSTIVIVVGIIAAAPQRSTSEFVWTSSYNTTGMDNMGYVYIIGLLTTLYGMSGYESASQISEETQNAQTSAPKGIVYGVIAAILTGLAFFLGILYSINGQIDLIAGEDGITDQPVVNAFQLAFTDNDGNPILSGALTMTILLVINVYLGGFSHMTVTTRVVFAMSRDGAFPCGKYIYGVNKRQIPVKSIAFVFVVDSLLCLLPIVNETAFSAITQISTIGYQISYAIPIILRITVSRNKFQQGPFNLGRLSIPIGWLSSIWLVATSICFFFPTQFDENGNQDPESFNYSCVVVGGVLLIAAIYWFFPKYGARNFFKGPPRPEDEEDNVKEVKLGMYRMNSEMAGALATNNAPNNNELDGFEENGSPERIVEEDGGNGNGAIEMKDFNTNRQLKVDFENN